MLRPSDALGEDESGALPKDRIVADGDARARRRVLAERKRAVGVMSRRHAAVRRPARLKRRRARLVVFGRKLHERDALDAARQEPLAISRRQAVQDGRRDEPLLAERGQLLLHLLDDVAERPARRDLVVDEDDRIRLVELRFERIDGESLLGRMAVLLQKLDRAHAGRQFLARRLHIEARIRERLRDDGADGGRRLGEADDEPCRRRGCLDLLAERFHEVERFMRCDGHVLALQRVDEQIAALFIPVPPRHAQHRVCRVLHRARLTP